MPERGISRDWEDIIESNPDIKKHQFNPERKKLLQEGISINLTRQGAESWISALRKQRETAEELLHAQNLPVPEAYPDVRVTILEIPEATRLDPVGGNILVEADGIQAQIDASLFYNSIYTHDKSKAFLSPGGGVDGWDNGDGRDNSVG